MLTSMEANFLLRKCRSVGQIRSRMLSVCSLKESLQKYISSSLLCSTSSVQSNTVGKFVRPPYIDTWFEECPLKSMILKEWLRNWTLSVLNHPQLLQGTSLYSIDHNGCVPISVEGTNLERTRNHRRESWSCMKISLHSSMNRIRYNRQIGIFWIESNVIRWNGGRHSWMCSQTSTHFVLPDCRSNSVQISSAPKLSWQQFCRLSP